MISCTFSRNLQYSYKHCINKSETTNFILSSGGKTCENMLFCGIQQILQPISQSLPVEKPVDSVNNSMNIPQFFCDYGNGMHNRNSGKIQLFGEKMVIASARREYVILIKSG